MKLEAVCIFGATFIRRQNRRMSYYEVYIQKIQNYKRGSLLRSRKLRPVTKRVADEKGGGRGC